jgi:predicted Rossmann fold nucleotide-binding protein DprA/Smf involved in DNA uptake
LLLTAPLISGRSEPSPDLLTPGEYKRLARHLHQLSSEPADLLSGEAEEILRNSQSVVDAARLKRLLARGFALSQAIERWQSRAIWVVSRADPDYPQRVRERLKDDRPAVLYGCGERTILDTGGLAVVGSRDVDDVLIEYTQGIGRLAAKSRKTLVSGGARGIDQAAMRGALEAGGKVSGVMADSLEKAAMNRENRSLLMDGQLVLVSPYDPGAGFNVGNAMQRNKLIYALADAALVVNSDLEKGGTWAGAVEQLDKLRFGPIYVRSDGRPNEALAALQRKGALPWPNPVDADGFINALENAPVAESPAEQQTQMTLVPSSDTVTADPKPVITPEVIEQPIGEPSGSAEAEAPAVTPTAPLPTAPSGAETVKPDEQTPASLMVAKPADALFSAAKQSILRVLESPKKAREIADELRVTETQTKTWLGLLVEAGAIEKIKGAAYRIRAADLIDLCVSGNTANESGLKP